MVNDNGKKSILSFLPYQCITFEKQRKRYKDTIQK